MNDETSSLYRITNYLVSEFYEWNIKNPVWRVSLSSLT
jgi:hypothetical protein